MRVRGYCIATLLLVGIASFACAADDNANYSFTPLGFAGGVAKESRANAASYDGSVVVGRVIMNNDFYHAFRWTRATGLTLLSDLPGGADSSQANGISRDGDVIVGINWDASGAQPALWSGPTSTATTLVTSPGGAPGGFASGISQDKSVVTGAISTGQFHAYRWTAEQGINFFTPYGGFSTADGVSAAGDVIVGYYAGGSVHQSYRWTAATGAVTLPDLPGGLVHSQAHAVSANGAISVGFSSSTRAFNGEAVLWDATGVHPLTDTPGPFTSSANGISDDGSIIVGIESYSSTFEEAFIWDSSNGMRSLRLVLMDHGVDLTGWKLYEATNISGDGRTIVGYGTNPSGATEAWVVTVPEPVLGLLLPAAAMLLRRSPMSRTPINA